MIFSHSVCKMFLLLHVITSVGLLGCVTSFFALAVLGLVADQVTLKTPVYKLLPYVTEWLVLPLLVKSLIIGLISGLGTPWGVLRHYWLLAKLALTVLSLAVLVVQLSTIFELARSAAGGNIGSAEFPLQLRLLIHSAGGLAVLCLVAWLSIYKPRDQTRFDF